MALGLTRLTTSSLLLVLIFGLTAAILETEADVGQDDDDLLQLTESLRRNPTVLYAWLRELRGVLNRLDSRTYSEPVKRGIDFGLGRGYSGNQAAKHYMGLVASNYVGGPGKKRSSS